MEAKDTVMNVEDCTNAYLSARFERGETVGERYLSIAEAQAEISFKAGQKQERKMLMVWANEPCPHIETTSEPPLLKWGCSRCWQTMP